MSRSTENVLLFVGRLRRLCLSTACLQSNSVIYALMSAMLAPKNVSAMTLTTASDAHKHVATVLKSVEELQVRLEK